MTASSSTPGGFVGPQEAEDAVADAMFSLWRRWPTLSLDQRADPQAVAMFEAGRRYDDISDALDSAVSCMPTRRREVLLLVYEQRFTYDEAAQSMGISFGSVKTHLRLAIADVRAAYARAGFRIEYHDVPRLSAPKGDRTNA